MFSESGPLKSRDRIYTQRHWGKIPMTKTQPRNQTHQQIKYKFSAQDSLRLRLELGFFSLAFLAVPFRNPGTTHCRMLSCASVIIACDWLHRFASAQAVARSLDERDSATASQEQPSPSRFSSRLLRRRTRAEAASLKLQASSHFSSHCSSSDSSDDKWARLLGAWFVGTWLEFGIWDLELV